MKKVLLICPVFMGLYKDIIKCLKELGYCVDFIPEKTFPHNPYYVAVKNRPKTSKKDYDNLLLNFWVSEIDSRNRADLTYDYLLVMDGLSMHPYLVDTLRTINPQIRVICYLFDRIKGVYQIDHNFYLYDKIYSFDLSDSVEYSLEHLPLYWIPADVSEKNCLDVFAFGSYDAIRKEVYCRIKDVCQGNDLSFYIKLYSPKISNKYTYSIKRFLLNTLLGRDLPSIKELQSPLFTDVSMTGEDFRKKIMSSKVIVDTNHPYQDGLTARFMWALGAGKKIITNNSSANNYDFYSKEQILIMGDGTTTEEILQFINSKCEISDKISEIINQYRIDNWLTNLLKLE